MISIRFDTDEIVPGQSLSGNVSWVSEKHVTPRKVSLIFGWHTEGRGSTAKDDVITCEHECGPVSEGQTVDIPFEVVIPEDVPVSYDGELIRLIWSLKVQVDLPWAFDPKQDREFRVVGPRVSA